jgi:K+-transporting ATPase ATPase A chain
MIGLTVQNWLSAGVGIVVAVALVRGIIGRSGKSLGNFWQDIVRTSSTCSRRCRCWSQSCSSPRA